jgi:hypothetical protein
MKAYRVLKSQLPMSLTVVSFVGEPGVKASALASVVPKFSSPVRVNVRNRVGNQDSLPPNTGLHLLTRRIQAIQMTQETKTRKSSNWGGYRPGSGRKPGSRLMNFEAREEARDKASAELTPLDYMLKVMRNRKAELRRRDWAAKEAAPYLHSKQVAVDHANAPPAIVNIVKFVLPESGDPMEKAKAIEPAAAAPDGTPPQ